MPTLTQIKGSCAACYLSILNLVGTLRQIKWWGVFRCQEPSAPSILRAGGVKSSLKLTLRASFMLWRKCDGCTVNLNACAQINVEANGEAQSQSKREALTKRLKTHNKACVLCGRRCNGAKATKRTKNNHQMNW